MTAPLGKAFASLAWLQDHPEFDEQPATIEEFLGPDYLNIASGVRDGVRAALVDIFGEEVSGDRIARVQRAMFTGAIGIGKTTLASIALPYMCHWVLCLRDPQAFFGLLPGSRIAFMQMSTSEDQAKEVLFGDIFARIKYSPWFKKYPYDEKFKNQIRFPKDIWIIPGDSAETTFEGYNILGGILDEIDSHRVTAKKDYAQTGYNTIHARITSRFQDRGLLILIGQMKKSVGFANKMYKEMRQDKNSVVHRMTIWESLGWPRFLKPDGTRDSFWYDARRKFIVPEIAAELMADKDHLMEIPNAYLKDFENDPDRALRDLAGIPPIVGSTFIGMVDRIYEARNSWVKRYELESPAGQQISEAVFVPWFRAQDSLPRVMHLDIAYSDTGDALGMAMGHIPEVKEIDGEDRPVIVFDFILRMRPLPGTEIVLSDIRQIIYHLRDDLNFRIQKVTMDGFQSTDTMQQLQKRRINTEYLSVDRNKIAYQDLRDALYERRIEFPPYFTYFKHGDTDRVEIAVRELSQLIDDGRKVDHPEGGSKDVADAMAGVCYTLMGEKRYRRGVTSSAASTGPLQSSGANANTRNSWQQPSGSSVPALPIPPSLAPVVPSVPRHLVPRNGGY